MGLNVKLSIVVAVYNVERYIRDCIESIYRQGLNENDFEVILINDGSEDNSIHVIKDLICLHNNVTIINQKNSGSSVAWNNGIANAKGEYILIVDADDVLIEGSLNVLLNKAFETKADILIADYVELDDENITPVKVSTVAGDNTTLSYQEMTGIELYINDLHPSKCYVWRKLYKKQFLIDNNLTFIPGIHFQDIPFTSECYILANKCVKSSQLLYIYRKRNILTTYDFCVKKCHENAIAIAYTWKLISRYHLTGKIKAKLKENVYVNFKNFSRRVSHLLKNFEEREYVFDHLRRIVPDFWPGNRMIQKMVIYIFHHHPLIYNYMRFLYARIFEDVILSYYRRLYFKLFK